MNLKPTTEAARSIGLTPQAFWRKARRRGIVATVIAGRSFWSDEAIKAVSERFKAGRPRKVQG